jgi:tryptophan-rich sensory protein
MKNVVRVMGIVALLACSVLGVISSFIPGYVRHGPVKSYIEVPYWDSNKVIAGIVWLIISVGLGYMLMLEFRAKKS